MKAFESSFGYLQSIWSGESKQATKIPKMGFSYVLYGELAIGLRPVGRPTLRYKDFCKRDLKLTYINTGSWELLAEDRSGWRQAVQEGSQERRGKEKQTDGREKNGEETETGSQPSDPIHLQQLWQRLSCQDWAPEPLQPLLSTSLRTNQGAHHCLSRQMDALLLLQVKKNSLQT